MSNILKRTIIIRADHFVKVCELGLTYNRSIECALYDRAKFVPLTIFDIEKHWTFAILKDLLVAENSWHIDKVLYFLKGHSVYSNEYSNSISAYSQDNKYFSVKKRNGKEELLGWGIFEKDFEA